METNRPNIAMYNVPSVPKKYTDFAGSKDVNSALQ